MSLAPALEVSGAAETEAVETGRLLIVGPGAANFTVNGNNASRVFEFSNVTAAISELKIAHGRQVNASSGGGGIYPRLTDLLASNCVIASASRAGMVAATAC